MPDESVDLDGSTKLKESISADKALTDPSNDRLEYAPFARKLADSICSVPAPEGNVIAVFGTWGAGKSTLLNFVVHYLKEKAENERPLIMRFAPWWFPGTDVLVHHFFDQFSATLGTGTRMESLRKDMATLCDLVSYAPHPYAPAAKFVKKFITPKPEDLVTLKEKIAKDLKRQSRRILVVIDDVDRLDAVQIRQLISVIKAVANFPNVAYLVAFDRRIVMKALKQDGASSGEDYLEKLVQLPIELPLPDRESLRRLLIEKLNALLADTPTGLIDLAYWSNVYYDGIDHFISTPRNVVRLMNSLAFTYPAVKGEVNSVDMIAVQTLQVFCPVVYDTIRKNPDMFAGYTGGVIGLRSSQFDVKYAQIFHESWMKNVKDEDKEPVKSLLMRIFPKLQAVWKNTYYPAEYMSEWRRQCRICVPELLPVYFRLALPEGSISTAELRPVLATLNDKDEFEKRLLQYASESRPDGRTRIGQFLDRFADYTEKEISQESISPIIHALTEVGDDLLRPEDEPRGMFDIRNDIRIARVVWGLLRRLDEPERATILKDAIVQGRATSTIVEWVTIAGQEQGKYTGLKPDPIKEWLVSADHLKELEESALEKIREAAKDERLLRTRTLEHVLYRWSDWGSDEEVKEWVGRIAADDGKLVILAEAFVSPVFGHTLGEWADTTRYRFDLVGLSKFLNPSQVVDRIRIQSEKASLSDWERIAVDAFIRAYDAAKETSQVKDGTG